MVRGNLGAIRGTRTWQTKLGSLQPRALGTAHQASRDHRVMILSDSRWAVFPDVLFLVGSLWTSSRATALSFQKIKTKAGRNQCWTQS